jgi:predicted DNA binding CopG/RHH family protein
MPTIKEHIEVVKTEIDKTGKRLETETLTADQIVDIAKRMSELAGALNWLNACESMNSRIKQPLLKSIN